MSEIFTFEWEPTVEEVQFRNFLKVGIATYIEKKPTDRTVLIAALSDLCRIVFCKETPLDIKEQCDEIDHFCRYLKNYAMRHAIKD